MKKTQKLFYHLFAIMLMCTLFCVTKADVNAQGADQRLIDGKSASSYEINGSGLLDISPGTHTLSVTDYDGNVSYKWKNDYTGKVLSTKDSLEINVDELDQRLRYVCIVIFEDGHEDAHQFIFSRQTKISNIIAKVNGKDYSAEWPTINCNEGSYTLSVSATSSNANELTFEWWLCDLSSNDPVTLLKTEQGTSSSYTFDQVKGENNIYCRIKDGHCPDYTRFYLMRETISAKSYVNSELYVDKSNDDEIIYTNVPYNSTLEVKATTSENTPLTYQWYESTDEYDIEITGANKSTYVIPKDKRGNVDYFCAVSDGVYEKTIWFSVALKDMSKPEVKPDPKPETKPEEKPQTQPTVTDTVKVGETYVIAGTSYKVLNGQTVQLKQVSKTAAKVAIPSVVTIQGKNYKVTEIASKAFKNNKKIKQVIIPSTVKKIGKQAFFNCKKLKKITVKTKFLTKKSVGSKAFKGVNPKVTIKVPKTKVKTYQKLFRAKGLSRLSKVR